MPSHLVTGKARGLEALDMPRITQEVLGPSFAPNVARLRKQVLFFLPLGSAARRARGGPGRGQGWELGALSRWACWWARLEANERAMSCSAPTPVLEYLNFHKVWHSHQGAGPSKCTCLSD